MRYLGYLASSVTVVTSLFMHSRLLCGEELWREGCSSAERKKEGPGSCTRSIFWLSLITPDCIFNRSYIYCIYWFPYIFMSLHLFLIYSYFLSIYYSILKVQYVRTCHLSSSYSKQIGGDITRVTAKGLCPHSFVFGAWLCIQERWVNVFVFDRKKCCMASFLYGNNILTTASVRSQPPLCGSPSIYFIWHQHIRAKRMWVCDMICWRHN